MKCKRISIGIHDGGDDQFELPRWKEEKFRELLDQLLGKMLGEGEDSFLTVDIDVVE